MARQGQAGSGEAGRGKARQLNTTTALDKSQWDTGTAWDEAQWKPFYNPGEKCGHFMSAYPYRAERRDVA